MEQYKSQLNPFPVFQRHVTIERCRTPDQKRTLNKRKLISISISISNFNVIVSIEGPILAERAGPEIYTQVGEPEMC